MIARDIANALGNARRLPDGGFIASCPVPGHGRGCGDQNPSLSLRDGTTGLLVHCFGGCDANDVFAGLRRRGLINGQRHTAGTPSPPQRLAHDHEIRQYDKAARLWANRKAIAGSPAETYLRTRGITGSLPPTLGFLPPSKPEYHPAMIAAFCVPSEPEPGVLKLPPRVRAVHLTLLKLDGSSKAEVTPNKLFIGRPLGRPIVVARPNDLLGLAITEGIEDALSAHEATGVGSWASGSAAMMPALADALPDYIEAITIYAHEDNAGQRGARGLADRLRRRSVEVFVEGVMS